MNLAAFILLASLALHADALVGPDGPPPFVQSKLASKGPPPGVGVPPALGPPPFLQSLMTAKAAGSPFASLGLKPLGPPPFIQQLIDAKNAAAAAQSAALAQQQAPTTAAAATGPAPMSDKSLAEILIILQDLLNAKAAATGPPEVPIGVGAPVKTAPPPPPPPPPAWMMDMMQANLASKAAKASAGPVAPASLWA